MKKITKKHPDLSQLAAAIVEAATDETTPAEEPSNKNPHAVELGRLGGKKGGKARAEKMTTEQLKEWGEKAAKARWGNKGKE